MRYRLTIGVVLSLLLLGCETKSVEEEASQSVTSVQISMEQTNVTLGTTVQMSAIGFTGLEISVENIAVTWESDNPSVATVDAKGVVSGWSVGIAIVSATLGTMTDTAIIGVVSPDGGSENLSISGTAFYEDKPFTEEGFTGELNPTPIRQAVVHLIAIDGFEEIAATQTDENGSYTFSNIDNSGRQGGVYVQILAKTADDSLSPAEIRDDYINNALIALTDLPLDDTLSDSFISEVVAPASGIGGAFNILDVSLQGGEFIQQVCSSCKPPFLTAYWQQGSEEGTFYATDGFLHAIFINGGVIESGGAAVSGDTDEYDDTIILHEYGHFMATAFSHDDSPGGEHYIGDNTQDIRLSWSEGWATFFASAVLDNPVALDTDSEGVVLTFNIDHPAFPTFYTTSETSISAVLWDIFDADASEVVDTLGAGFLPIWDSFTQILTTDPATMESFALEFIGQNLADTHNAFQAILKEREIEFFSDDAETSGEQTLSSSVQHHTLYQSDSDPFSDEDRIPFSVTAGQTYTVKTVNLTNGADTYLTIEDSSETVLYENDNTSGITYTADCQTSCPANDSTTLASSISFTAGTSGELFARVKRSPNAPLSTGRTGSYNIELIQP